MFHEMLGAAQPVKRKGTGSTTQPIFRRTCSCLVTTGGEWLNPPLRMRYTKLRMRREAPDPVAFRTSAGDPRLPTSVDCEPQTQSGMF